MRGVAARGGPGSAGSAGTGAGAALGAFPRPAFGAPVVGPAAIVGATLLVRTTLLIGAARTGCLFAVLLLLVTQLVRTTLFTPRLVGTTGWRALPAPRVLLRTHRTARGVAVRLGVLPALSLGRALRLRVLGRRVLRRRLLTGVTGLSGLLRLPRWSARLWLALLVRLAGPAGRLLTMLLGRALATGWLLSVLRRSLLSWRPLRGLLWRLLWGLLRRPLRPAGLVPLRCVPRRTRRSRRFVRSVTGPLRSVTGFGVPGLPWVARFFVRPAVISLVVHSRPSQIGASGNAVLRTQPSRVSGRGHSVPGRMVAVVTSSLSRGPPCVPCSAGSPLRCLGRPQDV